MIDKSFKEFDENFDIAENALSMRALRRWNGRDLPREENLSEHTHLVVACAIKLYDDFKLWKHSQNNLFEQIVRLAMIHDALEMYRGDILATTKDSVPGLREYIDAEEKLFQSHHCECCEFAEIVVRLADLMARYLFIKGELKYSTNEFTYEAFKNSKEIYYDTYMSFIVYNGFDDIYNIREKYPRNNVVFNNRFAKGYKEDAGIDVKLSKPFIILPHTTVSVDLECYCTPKEGEMAIMCARTSAAAKGLSVALCPIDPNYTGTLTAIVHNISNDVIEYKEGESFCQIVYVKLADETIHYDVKKEGKRSTGKLGSTGC